MCWLLGFFCFLFQLLSSYARRPRRLVLAARTDTTLGMLEEDEARNATGESSDPLKISTIALE